MTFPLFPTPFGAKFPTSKLLPRFRFLLFLPLPSLYLLFSKPSPLDFFSVIAFSAVLFTSLNFALSFFTRLFPTKFSSSSSSPHPVVWSIGSNPKQVKNTNWGCWVQVYSKWDVYEGEFQKGKCWGSGVYHYNMHGRYEGDWVDGKYDGYGVETWARGSRYRGQYREGLRNGMGIYKFYCGDVYGDEWSNGQCRVMGLESTLALMAAAMLGSSKGVSNMDSDSTISEMGTYMLVNILQTRCMVLECINFRMVIGMRGHGMKEEDKDRECTLSEMGKHNVVTGRMGFLKILKDIIVLLGLHVLWTIPRFLMQYRTHILLLKKLTIWQRWMAG
ncbi:hypothetical protein JHK87_011907 [Glycine soja]|nr:hypothetical protein JHK87_011907 [Glycine soja]